MNLSIKGRHESVRIYLFGRTNIKLKPW